MAHREGIVSLKRLVDRFWNEYPCGRNEYLGPGETVDDYMRLDEEMYRNAPATHDYARQLLEPLAGKVLLEIGCGLGRDGRFFASRGAGYIGGDLTANALRLARKGFRLLQQPGSFLRLDAEQLPLADASVDIVYSWGVIHHTPDISRAIGEIRRVLNREGRIMLALYNRNSDQYYYNMLFKKRIILSLIKFSPMRLVRIGARFDRRILQWKETVEDQPISNANLRRWFSDGNGRHNPLTNVYSEGEVRELLAEFRNIRIRIFPVYKLGPVGNLILRLFGHRIGWDMIVYAEK